MSIPFSDELNKLFDLYEPYYYYDENMQEHMLPNTPLEAIEAHDRFIELGKKESAEDREWMNNLKVILYD